MPKTKSCKYLINGKCLAKTIDDCPKKRLPKTITIFCHRVPVIL